MGSEPDAPASEIRRESSMHSLARRAGLRNPTVQRSSELTTELSTIGVSLIEDFFQNPVSIRAGRPFSHT
jgi:hypothetical protein